MARAGIRLSDLFTGEEVRIDGGDVEVTGLAYDSRSARAGVLFAALPGAKVDGHDFIAAAVAQGASAILCERPVDTGSATRVLTAEPRRVLARVADRFYGHPAAQLRTVGVTGTNGKTTTVHLIESILEQAGLAPGIIGTLGARYAGSEGYADVKLTTPESVDLMALVAEMVRAGSRSLAMEVSSHALALGRVAGLSFNVGVFTNLTHDHLDFHGSLDAYFAAKSELVEQRLKPGGWRVLNRDDERVRTLNRDRSLTFSAEGWELADVRLLKGRIDADGCNLDVATVAGPLRLRSPLIGGFNVENILAAATTGLALGLEHPQIEAGIAGLQSVPGRLERVSEPGEPLVLVDYAHTPDALEKALRAVREVTRGRIHCVFGCGGDRDPHKRQPMGDVVGRLAHRAILTNDNPRGEAPEVIAAPIEAGLRAAGAVAGEASAAERTYAVTLDRARAIEQAVRAAAVGDTVLIAGKGHETYQLVGTETLFFDDREQARSALGPQADPGRHRGRAPNDR